MAEAENGADADSGLGGMLRISPISSKLHSLIEQNRKIIITTNLLKTKLGCKADLANFSSVVVPDNTRAQSIPTKRNKLA